jgi:hypothetical protein
LGCSGSLFTDSSAISQKPPILFRFILSLTKNMPDSSTLKNNDFLRKEG